MANFRALAVSLLLVIAGVSFGFTMVDRASAQSDQVTLTVTVVDRNGDSIGNIDLVANWEGGSTEATTASNGKAFVDVPKGADVSLDIDDDRYVRNTPKVVTDASERDVTLDVARQGRATVTARDAAGSRVEGATVRLFRNAETIVDAETGPDGRTTTKPIERGEYTLRVVKAGYYRNQTTIEVGNQTSKTVTIEQGSVVVTFNVTDDHFSPARPVENATVSIDDVGSVTTLSNGEATVSVPVNTRLSLSVTKEGYGTTERSPRIRESKRTFDLQIQRVPELTIESLSDRVVVGESTQVEVTDEYGAPVANATVTVGDGTVGKTDDGGRIAVPIESQGNVTVTAEKGELSATVTVTGVRPATETPEATPTPTATPTATPEEGPGFSALLALLGLLGFGAASRRFGR